MSHHKCLAKCCSYGTVSLMLVRTVCDKTSGLYPKYAALLL